MDLANPFPLFHAFLIPFVIFTIIFEKANIVKMAKINPNAPVLRKDLDQAVDAILTGMDNMINSPNNQIQKRFDNIDGRLSKLESGQSYIRDEIKGIKSELSLTV